MILGRLRIELRDYKHAEGNEAIRFDRTLMRDVQGRTVRDLVMECLKSSIVTPDDLIGAMQEFGIDLKKRK